MTSRTKRSEIMLEKMASRLGMTEKGKCWVTAALDPFHDNPINLEGFPDGATGNSIVQLFKLTATVAAPSGVTGSASWDCHIFDLPWTQAPQVPFTSVVSAGGNNNGQLLNGLAGQIVKTAASQVRPINPYGLNIWTGITGAQMSFAGMGYNIFNSATNYGVQNLQLSSLATLGKHRVIAKAFEVHNTSAELYKGGTICAYRQPTPDVLSGSTYNYIDLNGSTTSINAQLPVDTVVMESPPASISSALLLPGSKQWEAKDGLYSVSALHSTEVPPHWGQLINPLVTDYTTLNQGVVGVKSLYSNSVSYQTPSGTTVNLPVMSSLNFSQFDFNGCYITGLTSQSTLQVNWNVYVQRFPTNDDIDLVVLANPSPERDNVALDFYTHAVQNLPVGVPVGANGLGDWFRDALATASDFIAPVLSAIPHPYAQGASAIIRGASGIANKLIPAEDGAASLPSPYQTARRAEVAVIPRVIQESARERVAYRQRKAADLAYVRGQIRARNSQAVMNRRPVSRLGRRNMNFKGRSEAAVRPNRVIKKKGGIAFVV